VVHEHWATVAAAEDVVVHHSTVAMLVVSFPHLSFHRARRRLTSSLGSMMTSTAAALTSPRAEFAVPLLQLQLFSFQPKIRHILNGAAAARFRWKIRQ
jgi:hypothetical protein